MISMESAREAPISGLTIIISTSLGNRAHRKITARELPWPMEVLAVTVPCWASTSDLATASPNPAPGPFRERSS